MFKALWLILSQNPSREGLAGEGDAGERPDEVREVGSSQERIWGFIPCAMASIGGFQAVECYI